MDWLKHLKDREEREEFATLLRNNTQLFTVLRNILQEKKSKAERSKYSLDDFQDTDWAVKQAFRNGYMAAYSELQTLTEFIERIKSK